MEIYKHISALVNYAIDNHMLREDDRIYSINRILDLLNLDSYVEYYVRKEVVYPSELLDPILDYAAEKGIIQPNTITFRDIFDAKIMDCIMDRPYTVREKFFKDYDKDPYLATSEYYKLAVNSNYIRKNRTDKNVIFKVGTDYGAMDITINVSKPEKDPRDIAAAKNVKSDYPSCLLCAENEGYKGTVSHPGRANHRIIPVELAGKQWFFQYSPYVYYNEHCIIFDKEHVPMVISKTTFNLMLEFVSKFKHYFVGSNADLPIVGGSILAHNHFQGGNYEFAMAKAKTEKQYDKWQILGVKVERVKWPLSTIRISGKDWRTVADCSYKVFEAWKNYSDEEEDILSETNGESHNTVTPIARYKNGMYECDIVLRNNRTSSEYPLGIFHPHNDIHHIKRENIGLIEVMGLAVLPARLVKELELVKEYILNGKIEDEYLIEHHISWVESMKERYNFNDKNIDDIIHHEVGSKFAKGLEHCGVFKRNHKGMTAFDKFVESI